MLIIVECCCCAATIPMTAFPGDELGITAQMHVVKTKTSTKHASLYQLHQEDAKWTWGRRQNKAFQAAKSALQSKVLVCDASQYGPGAVLYQVMEDGKERPVTYVSWTLTSAEKN